MQRHCERQQGAPHGKHKQQTCIENNVSPAGNSGDNTVRNTTPAPISMPVTLNASLLPMKRLFKEEKTATNAADAAPITMPARIPSGVPPTTSATPGKTAMPKASSRTSKRRRVSSGSMNATNTGVSAMQVAATDALLSLMEP
jgi:hypothetical protein